MADPQILIVEDDPEIRELYRMLLEGEGFHVDTTTNGEEALSYLDSHPTPCLILLDMTMPIMGGREFMKGFEKRPHRIVPIPIYLVSATADPATGREMGCFGFVKKPFDADVLVAIVRAHCKLAAQEQPFHQAS